MVSRGLLSIVLTGLFSMVLRGLEYGIKRPPMYGIVGAACCWGQDVVAADWGPGGVRCGAGEAEEDAPAPRETPEGPVFHHGTLVHPGGLRGPFA